MSNELASLAPNPGSTKARKRVGRGEGSGKGTTAGRGTKGDKSRGGYKRRPQFEGGQTPLMRRLPKVGFTNVFAKDFEVLNVEQLERLAAGTVVTAELLKAEGIISRIGKNGVKLLGRGEIGVALQIRLAKVSAGAKEKILAAGGSVDESLSSSEEG
ncbi:MAG: 50S ribosomal protein L15 [Alphaproteobacteria bacterium]|nr:50S ribosomal protein L15 [Alphaproteobacteria bacterium]